MNWLELGVPKCDSPGYTSLPVEDIAKLMTLIRYTNVPLFYFSVDLVQKLAIHFNLELDEFGLIKE